MGAEFPGLEDIYAAMQKVEKSLAGLIPKVARTNAPGDPFQNLLTPSGCKPHRSTFTAATPPDWSTSGTTMPLPPAFSRGRRWWTSWRSLPNHWPRSWRLSRPTCPVYSACRSSSARTRSGIRWSTISLRDEVEKLSETKKLRAIYQVPDPANPGGVMAADYIGWIAFSPYSVLKAQSFAGPGGRGAAHPAPAALPYAALCPAAGHP